MIKLFKLVIRLVIVLVLLVLGAVLTLPLWFGPVVTSVANKSVPNVVKTDFHLGHAHFNPYLGYFALGDMQLKNPTGYSEENALTLNKFEIDVDMGTVLNEVIHIERITIADVFFSYVSANGVNNIEQIKYNVAGGKEKYEAKKQAKEQTAQAQVEQAKTAPEKDNVQPQKDEKPAKKFVIDRLELFGLRVKIGPMPIPLPPITLTDVGKKTNGATLAEVCDQVTAAVMKVINQLGDGAKVVGALLGDGANKTVDALGAGAKAIKLDAAKDKTVEGAAKAVDGASKALDGAGNVIKGASGVLKDTSSKLKGLFGN